MKYEVLLTKREGGKKKKQKYEVPYYELMHPGSIQPEAESGKEPPLPWPKKKMQIGQY